MKIFLSKTLQSIFTVLFALLAYPVQADQGNHAGDVEVVWGADRQGLFSLDPETDEILQRTISIRGIRDLAVDAANGRVWAYGKQTLHAFTLDGIHLFSQEIFCDDHQEQKAEWDEDKRYEKAGLCYFHNRCDHRNTQLLTHPKDGSVWMARGRILRRLDEQGSTILTVPFNARIKGVCSGRGRNDTLSKISLLSNEVDSGMVLNPTLRIFPGAF